MSNEFHTISALTFDAIQAEVIRSQVLHGSNSMMSAALNPSRRLAILVEEVGEVAKELNETALGAEADKDKLEKELIQVSAMAASWIETLNMVSSSGHF